MVPKKNRKKMEKEKKTITPQLPTTITMMNNRTK